jgi:hypothetical protein
VSNLATLFGVVVEYQTIYLGMLAGDFLLSIGY